MRKSNLTAGIYCAAVSLVAASASTYASVSVKIDPDKTYQTIDNFAAADAWSGNFVGQFFDEAQKGQVAKWLFSQKLGADGNPEGIGLSLWRVNVGGGSLEQDGADIGVYQRRAESFLTKDGKGYDWGKCSGQQYFMRKAKEYGGVDFLLFSNSPPVQWTRNGKGYGIKDDFSANLKPDAYGKFADFMADVAKHFADEGYNIRYISPINEPQVNWNASYNQEGSPWLSPEIAKVFRELDRAMTERKLDNTKMLLGEAAVMKHIYGTTKPAYWKNPEDEKYPNYMVRKFFSPDSADYIGDLKHMPKMIGGHSYHTHKTSEEIRDVRNKVRQECEKYGVEFQQTEWCLLPQYGPKNHDCFSKDWASDNRADIQTALLMARIIHSDFVDANSTAWGYWKGMEVNGNYALIGVYPTNGDLTKGGVVRDNKLLWALGNYSLFVRPDYKRIELEGANDIATVAGTAFISPDSKRIVAVFINNTYKDETVSISLPDSFKKKLSSISGFKTDANSDLANMKLSMKDDEITLSPRSITTVVLDF